MKQRLALGEELGLVVGRVVVMVRVVGVGPVSRIVAVAVVFRVGLRVRMRRAGIAMRPGKQVQRQPGDVKHQRSHRQPAGGGA